MWSTLHNYFLNSFFLIHLGLIRDLKDILAINEVHELI